VDLDGVVWQGAKLLTDNIAGLKTLMSEGTRLLFITNNASRSRRLYASILSRVMGVEVDVDSIVTSAYATAKILSSRLGKLYVYVVGGPGLVEELSEEGHIIVTETEVERCLVDAVVVGFTRCLSYVVLATAVKAIVKCGARLVATNTDRLLPSEEGFEPGAGSIVSAIEAASGVKAWVIGKPNPEVVEPVRDLLHGAVVVIGDKVETDMELARVLGYDGLLVDRNAKHVKRRQWYVVAPSVQQFANLPKCS
jgi:HAD superfamily hydrolase (TIGR01450 family)